MSLMCCDPGCSSKSSTCELQPLETCVCLLMALAGPVHRCTGVSDFTIIWAHMLNVIKVVCVYLEVAHLWWFKWDIWWAVKFCFEGTSTRIVTVDGKKHNWCGGVVLIYMLEWYITWSYVITSLPMCRQLHWLLGHYCVQYRLSDNIHCLVTVILSYLSEMATVETSHASSLVGVWCPHILHLSKSVKNLYEVMTQHPLSERYRLAHSVIAANDTESKSISVKWGVGSIADDHRMLCNAHWSLAWGLQ